jgi:hypothetical protein
MFRIFYFTLFFIGFLFAKSQFVDIQTEGTAMSRSESHKIAVENACSMASQYFKTQVTTKSTNINGDFTFLSVQTSSANLRMIDYWDKKLDFEHTKYGTIFYTKMSVRCELIPEKSKPKETVNQTKNEVISNKINDNLNTKKPKTENKPKPKPQKTYNFKVSTDFKIKNKYWRNLDKYILIVPKSLFKKVYFTEKTFEKNSQTYRKISKYLHKINNNHVYKNLKKGSYKVAFLLEDKDFFLIESKNYKPNFRDLNFKYSFNEHYIFTDSDFRAW